MLKVLLLLMFVSASLTKTNTSSKCPFFDGIYTSVMRKIYHQGFHKELFTEVELMLTTSMLPPHCRIVIEETVPKGMYVDPDQLRDMEETHGLKTFVAAKVDVEKPEYESEAFRLFIFRHLKIQENLRVTSVIVPVHLRYHKPSFVPIASQSNMISIDKSNQQQPVAIVRMQNPRILLSCDTDNVASLCHEKSVMSYCDPTGSSKCEYLEIPYKVNVNSIEVAVPVGNIEHVVYVVAITSFIVSGATVYLLVTLFREAEVVK